MKLATQHDDVEAWKNELTDLDQEHKDLDDVIARLSDNPTVDDLELRRLKKRKLAIKDRIARLQTDISEHAPALS